MFVQVAASAAETRPSRRELFKDENDENSENCVGRRLIIDDHDYGNSGGGGNSAILSRTSSFSVSQSDSAVETPANNDSGNSSCNSVQTPTSSISSLSLISPITSSAPNSAASSIGGSIVKVHFLQLQRKTRWKTL